MALRCRFDHSDSINMTPIIDIVFNLLIFFLLSSTYLHEQSQLELELPQVSTASPITEAPDEITVQVLADGRVMLEGKELSLASLRTRLREAHANYPDQAVAVSGDARVMYERVAEVIAVCKEAQIKRLDVLVQEK